MGHLGRFKRQRWKRQHCYRLQRLGWLCRQRWRHSQTLIRESFLLQAGFEEVRFEQARFKQAYLGQASLKQASPGQASSGQAFNRQTTLSPPLEHSSSPSSTSSDLRTPTRRHLLRFRSQTHCAHPAARLQHGVGPRELAVSRQDRKEAACGSVRGKDHRRCGEE